MTSKEITTHLTWLGKRLADILTTTHTHPLAPSWEFVAPAEDDSRNVYLLQRGTGARIYLQLSCTRGHEVYDRVEVSGWFHIGKNGSFVEVRDNLGRIYPTISASLARNPEAIAKDIAKRFLPAYLAAFERALAIVEDEYVYEARIRNVLRRTAHAAGFNVPKAGENDREIRKSVAGRIQGIEVDIYASQDTVKLVLDDLHVTQAEAIIGYIKTLKRIA
jgi:hypothetical protein